MARFAALRNHSWYSLLEGGSSPHDLLERAAQENYHALALTDTNSLAGVPEFVEAARRFSVRPIIGACLQHQNQRVTALVAEASGYRSLCRILHRLHFQNPPSLVVALTEHGEGLHLLVDDPFILKPPLTDKFAGRLWLELVRPSGKTEAAELTLMEVGVRYRIKPVASLAARFPIAAGHGLYRLLTAVRQQVALDQLPARLPVMPAHHLASIDEIHERFRDVPNAVANAAALAEMCRSDVLPRGTVLPPAKLPPGQEPHGFLRLTCERAFRQRAWSDEPAALRRLEHELTLIGQRDLAPYFLVVADIAEEARRRGWPMALRGSAGSSLVCHLLGITSVDPLQHGLRVERFLNPGREDLPDIDLDLASQVRRQVFAWVLQRYGNEHVARVGMVEHLRARSAFRAAAQAFGVPAAQVGGLLEELGDAVESLSPAEEATTIAVAPPSWPLEPAVWPKLLTAARALVGRPNELAHHPSGIVLTAAPVADLVPVTRGPGNVRVCQFDKDGIEHVGLVKIDLLSNRALSTLAEARNHLQVLAPEEAVTAAEDTGPAAATLLAQGDTLGIAQVETPAMRRLLRQVSPKGLTDLVHALAVTRPGAAGGKETYLRRRHGLEPPSYPHPTLEPILRETYGVLLTEDDALSVIEALTGLPAAEADRFRRRLADPVAAEETAEQFLAVCERNAVPRAAAQEVLGPLRAFESYAFCKAHAVSYALIAWQEATLKARHPLAFWVAALNNHQGAYPRWVHVEAAKRAGLQAYLPCVNRSRLEFTAEVSGFRTGLAAVRSLGRQTATLILEERERGGAFGSWKDFRGRVTLTTADLALLIRAGALDFCGRGRMALLREIDGLRLGHLPPNWREEETDLWPGDDLGRHPLLPQWKDEWEVLGFFAGGMPLLHLLRSTLPCDLIDSRALPGLEGKDVRLAGLVASVKEEAETPRALTLEDEWGLVEVALLPNAGGNALREKPGPLVLVEGRVELRAGVPIVVARQVDRPLPGTTNRPAARTASPTSAPQRNGKRERLEPSGSGVAG